MRLLPLLLVLLLLPASAADARRAVDVLSGKELKNHPDLWATVNVCDTEKKPDRIGIRASMPGDGRRLELFMRFRVQYRSDADGSWNLIEQGADSGWQRVGLTRTQVRESGWTFRFDPPTDGSAHVLRGMVNFEWRNRTRALRKRREFTEPGHKSRVGADPPNFSAEICEIR